MSEGSGVEKSQSVEESAKTAYHEGIHVANPELPEDSTTSVPEQWAQWCASPLGAPPGPPECPEGTVEVAEGVCESVSIGGGDGDGDGDGDGEGGGCTWWTFWYYEWSYVFGGYVLRETWEECIYN
ncbi:MAG: hypothetical protein ACREX4_20625 [Gammaproteobacteria bacterium]